MDKTDERFPEEKGVPTTKPEDYQIAFRGTLQYSS
jgi:hypothetical protein